MTRQAERSGTRAAVLILLAAKLLVLWFAVQAFIVVQNESLPEARRWIEIWNKWDAPHYADLIRDGYQSQGEERYWIVYYPLYPWTARVFHWVIDDPVVAAFLVSTIASLFAAALLYKLARLDDEEDVARDAVFFFAIFPTAYFLHIGYTESLFLALVLGSFLFSRRENWLAAGALGALAGLTRINGLLLIPALAFEAWAAWRRTRKFDVRWLALLAPGLGFLGYLLLNKMVTGSATTFLVHQREHWNKSLAMPWVSIADAWQSVWGRLASESIMVGWQEFLFTILAIAGTVWAWMRLRPSYAMWATLNVLLWTSTSFLLSAPRYAISVFPLFFWFARMADGRPVARAAITIWSLLFLGFFTMLFVTGKWAF